MKLFDWVKGLAILAMCVAGFAVTVYLILVLAAFWMTIYYIY